MFKIDEAITFFDCDSSKVMKCLPTLQFTKHCKIGSKKRKLVLFVQEITGKQ